MKVVYICSPLRGDMERNISKAHEYCRRAINMGVIPIAPHAVYTRYLDDRKPEQRERGLLIGQELLLKCDEVWAFGFEISEGMADEIEIALQNNIPVYLCEDPNDPAEDAVASGRLIHIILDEKVVGIDGRQNYTPR